MSESTRNLLVGLFVLAAMITFSLLMVWFGETPSWLQRGEWELKIFGVHEIKGVGEGSPVLLNGVEIGRIADLNFQQFDKPGRGVIISTRIKNDYSVPQGSTAKIYGSLLGIGRGSIQVIVPDKDVPLLQKDGTAMILGETASALGEIVSKEFTGSIERAVSEIADLAEAAKPVADNLAKTLEPRTIEEVSKPGAKEAGIVPNFTTAVERVDQFVANLNEIVGDDVTQTDIKQLASELRTAATDMRDLLKRLDQETTRTSNNLNHGIDLTQESIVELKAKLVAAIDRLDETAGELYTTMRAINEGKGTAGLLINDPRLYEAAVLSFDRLSEVLAGINRITSKIEKDGHITIGQKTLVGTLTKDFPVGDAQTTPK